MNLISSGGVYSSVKSVSDEVEGIDTRVDTLEEGEIYSTTEKVIGKWIDGKPIYRKVIHSISSFSSLTWGTLANNDFNCKKVVTEGIAHTGDSVRWINIEVSSTVIKGYNMGATINVGDLIIIEYTKTTD